MEPRLKKGELICEWDPYNALIISEVAGTVSFDNVIDGITFREESDEQTGFKEKVIVESRDRTKNPLITILDTKGELVKNYNLPVGSTHCSE